MKLATRVRQCAGVTAAAALILTAVSAQAGAAQAATPQASRLADDITRIHNAFFGRCLDADTGSISGNGTKVQLWDCNGWNNQSWDLLWDGTIRSMASGRCLDADTGSISGNGTKVQLWDCNGWNNQKWYVPGDGTIRSMASGRCLDADLGSISDNGTRVQLWDCNGWNNQKWYR
jgi:opacity protein-like surface antigen